MRGNNWANVVEPLIIGVAVYIVMRFLVPHSIAEEQRSLIGAGATFVIAMTVLEISRSKRA